MDCSPPGFLEFQASMEFSRQGYWRGLPFLSPEELPNSGIEPWSLASQADFFTIWAIRKSLLLECNYFIMCFCCTTKWVSFMYLLPLGPPPTPHHPCRPSQSTELSSLLLYGSFSLAVCLTCGSLHASVILSVCPALPSSPACVCMSVLVVCIFILAQQIGTSIPFL